MVYIAPADFRTATLQAWTNGLDLTTTEASDADLTAAIAEAQAEVDLDLDDHFESESLTLYVPASGGRRLLMPKRIQTVTSVALRQSDGSYVVQDASLYVVVASISGGSVSIRQTDYLAANRPVWWGGYSFGLNVLTGEGFWPVGSNAVQVVGTFSWPTTPTAVKRLTAIYVWKRFKAFDAYQDAASPVGDAEIEGIISRYRRAPLYAA